MVDSTPVKKSGFREMVSRKLIWDSFAALLNQKPFKKISIKEICEKSNMNRSTFYNYFVDKYDLLEYGLSEVILKESGLKSRFNDPIKDVVPHATFFKLVHENQDFWYNLFVVEGMNGFSASVMQKATENFFTFRPEEGSCHPPKEVAAIMYFGAVGALTTWWLKEHCLTPISQLNEWVDCLWNYE